MKYLTTLFAAMIIVIACNAQPHTKTTIEAGIISPVPQKSYRLFAEVKDDTSSSRLVDGMDFLDPNVGDLEIIIGVWTASGDTLFGSFDIPDMQMLRYIKGGLIQVDNRSLKYSAMTVSEWIPLDTIEQNAAGFIFRKKKK